MATGTTATATQKEDGASPHHKNNDDFSTNTNDIPFEIIELGGGRGTNAKLILSYLKEIKPHVYSSLTSYTLVDSSPSLHKTQMERLSGGPHAEKVRFELKDLVDVAQGTTSLVSKSDIPTVVMGMEVLDNLPHDKIRGRIRHKLEQAEVLVSMKEKKTKTNNSKQQQKYEEKFVSLSDPLLKTILRTVPKYYKQQQSTTSTLQTDACWIPSIACGVLRHAIHQRPNLGLVMADFDWLPDPDLDPNRNNSEDGDGGSSKFRFAIETPANWSPIVTDMEGIDHESYLTAPPHCDILFPTDFEKLASFVKRCLPISTKRRAPTINTSLHQPGRSQKNMNTKSASFSQSLLPEPASNSNSSTETAAAAASRTTTMSSKTTPVVRVEKQSRFLERWGQEHVAKTRSWLTGHTPLLHDFVNCSVLTISPEESTGIE